MNTLKCICLRFSSQFSSLMKCQYFCFFISVTICFISINCPNSHRLYTRDRIKLDFSSSSSAQISFQESFGFGSVRFSVSDEYIINLGYMWKKVTMSPLLNNDMLLSIRRVSAIRFTIRQWGRKERYKLKNYVVYKWSIIMNTICVIVMKRERKIVWRLN